MEENLAKEKIINALKQVSLKKQNPRGGNDIDIDVFCKPDSDIEVDFAKNFSENGGKLIFCETDDQLLDNLVTAIERFNWTDIYCDNTSIKEILDAAGIKYKTNIGNQTTIGCGMTLCDALVARRGSIAISSLTDKRGKLSTSANVHVVFATIDQIVPTISDALERIKEHNKGETPDFVNIISAPSSTTAIENTITVGAQGSKELYLFLLA